MTKKLDEEHLLLIQQLRDEFAENSNVIGNNSIRIHMLQKEIDKLNSNQDTAIAEAQRWDTNKKMSKLCFAIVKIKYNQDSGITGLAEISAVINNTLTKPGAVIKDYLTNSRYGAGLSVDRINLTTLTELDTYSDEYIYYTPSGGGSQQYTSRYRINGPIDTTKNFLDNLNQICDSCDTWLGYNEKDNKWNVIVNRSVYDLDPTGAGDSFAGGISGILSNADKIDFETLKMGIIYGSVLASFTVEQFGVKALLDVTSESINDRIEQFRTLTSFEWNEKQKNI